eukprot:Gregarina_sp_Poly_1__1985@NODE_151_length_12545_cov_99_072047_g134_i0_p2_GENE_NODE_151_length_12545_cov_99_072047_g134_i0NODE_151_length_12545_cov_99_072047_g134_i0_p2_ORF_typecomplete_len838_score119_57Abhydrolase_2/PF02230_16/1_2e02Abhydrolase_2/PF02230_16/1_6e20Abhydrolase_2/PF02230_16/7_3e03FSH1/PF03959_13/3_8e03FSH1/PF03959_13/2_1e08Hydrolase_4/PF12146_8/1e03Hydrolase_4/PF12146_8/4_1e08Peptidase_S9/PF00326_21/1_9e06Abhydrolase_1/PF00561_20/3_3e03Abhydrolase_1/PF00561_20/5_3e06Esterase_phd/P
MTTAVDRKRLLQFLDAIDTSSDVDSPSTGGGLSSQGYVKAVVRGGRVGASSERHHSERRRSLQRYDLSTDQLRQIYKESLKRAGGKLVHRFERRIAELDCLCYQNSHAPRIAILFFHGFDGSPYDFLFPVRKFFDVLGDRLPSLWVLPAGPERSRAVSDLSAEQNHNSPAPRSPVPVAEVSEIRSPGNHNKYIIDSPFGVNPSLRQITSEDILKRKLAELAQEGDNSHHFIDPSGGYMWWDIPAMNLLNGGKKSLKSFVQALKQNLRTPKSFFAVRSKVIDTIQAVGHSWGIPFSQIFIGGFSQGAMLASDILVAVPSNLAGGILLSGAPIGRSDHKQAHREAQVLHSQDRNIVMAAALEQHKNAPAHLCPHNLNESRFQVPIFQAHGTRDPIIPFPVGKFLRKHLANLGFNQIHFEAFPGGHDFPMEVGNKVFQWMLSTPPVRALANRRSNSGIYTMPPQLRMSRESSSSGKNRRRSSHASSIAQGFTEGGKSRLGKFLDKFRTGRRRASAPKAHVAVDAATAEGLEIGTMDSDADVSLCAGSPSPPIGKRRACNSLSFVSQDGPDAAHSEDEVDFPWDSLSLRASRAVAEMFLTVNNYTRTQILPELEEGSIPLEQSMLPIHCRDRQLSLYQSLEADELAALCATSDWTVLHRHFASEFSRGEDDLSSFSDPPPFLDAATPSTICSSPSPRPCKHVSPRQHSRKPRNKPVVSPGSRFANWEASGDTNQDLKRSPVRLGLELPSPLRTSYDTLSSWCEGSPADRLEGDEVFGAAHVHSPGAPLRRREEESPIIVPRNAYPHRHQKMNRITKKIFRSSDHHDKSRSESVASSHRSSS